MSLTTLIKAIQDIMRKDVGVDGDAQRISRTAWLIFLKSFDDKKQVWDESNPTEKIRPKPYFCVEHIFWGVDGLEGWFRTDDKSGLIKFKDDKHKVGLPKKSCQPSTQPASKSSAPCLISSSRNARPEQKAKRLRHEYVL